MNIILQGNIFLWIGIEVCSNYQIYVYTMINTPTPHILSRAFTGSRNPMNKNDFNIPRDVKSRNTFHTLLIKHVLYIVYIVYIVCSVCTTSLYYVVLEVVISLISLICVMIIIISVLFLLSRCQ